MRPTTDKLRSSVFSILGDKILGASVLDAFSGTGAYGIESYSRGAASVIFLDFDTADVKRNVNLLPSDFQYCVERRDFFKSFREVGNSFHIIFIDPPYGIYKTEDVLNVVAERNILKPCGIIIYEEFFKTPFSCGEKFSITDERKYGDTVIRFLEDLR